MYVTINLGKRQKFVLISYSVLEKYFCSHNNTVLSSVRDYKFQGMTPDILFYRYD